MSSPAVASQSFVLKIAQGTEVLRVPLKGAADFPAVQEVLRRVWTGPGEPSAKYEDEDGDLCGLVEATFADFLTTAKPSGGRQVLRVKLLESVARPIEVIAAVTEPQAPEEYRLDEQDSQCPSPRDSSSELDEQEAFAMAEQARQACHQVLIDHLQAWLASDPPCVRFEAWIGEVHPENYKNGAVDARMYHEAGEHRQIWNSFAAGAPGLTDDERECRYVVARDDGLIGPLAGRLPDMAAMQPSAPPLPREEEAVEPFLQVEAPNQPAVSVPIAPSSVDSEVTDPSSQPAAHSRVPASAVDSNDEVCLQPEGGEGLQHEEQNLHVKTRAARYVARILPALAAKLSRRASKTDRVQPSLPQELRPGLELLSEVLQISGPQFEAVADAADDVFSERILFGTGSALLATRAAALPWESRSLFAQLLCENCPQLLSPFVPACVLAPFCTSGSGSAEAWQAREAAKAAYHQQRIAAKAAYREAVEAARVAQRQNAEAHRDAMHQLALAHAHSCRQAAEVHRASCRTHTTALRAAAAEARTLRSMFAWWR